MCIPNVNFIHLKMRKLVFDLILFQCNWKYLVVELIFRLCYTNYKSAWDTKLYHRHSYEEIAVLIKFVI